MITKPEPMFTPADVMGPRTTPLVPVVVTIFTRETPARLPQDSRRAVFDRHRLGAEWLPGLRDGCG